MTNSSGRGAETAADLSRQHAMHARDLADRAPDDYFAEELRSMADDFDANAEYIREEVTQAGD